MSAILSIVAGFFKLVGAIADYFRDQQLIEAGKNKQVVEDLKAEKAREDENTKIIDSVANANDVERQRLRNKWTFPDSN